MNSRLLVATDLTDAAYNALMCATNLAKNFKSEIVLLHVFEVADIDENAKRLISSSFLNRDIKRQLEETVMEIINKEGVKTSYLTKEGDLFSALAEACIETNSEILFVGTHGVQGVQHLTGSFIVKTINSNSVPVWIVQKETVLKPYKNIFVLIDELLDDPLHPYVMKIAELYGAKINFVFTTSPNEFAVSSMLEKLGNVLLDKGIAHEVINIYNHPDKQKSLLDIAFAGEAPLIITDRNGKDSTSFVNIFTNKHHIEVLCLNTQ